PDSAWIAFGFADESSSGVAKVRPDGTEFTVLTEELTGWVQWSPTSDRIAVLTASRVGDSGPELDLELAMMDGTGSSHEVIAELGRCACLGLAPGFAWAPDGTMLVV